MVELDNMGPAVLTLDQIDLDALLNVGTYANTHKCHFKGTVCVIKQMKGEFIHAPCVFLNHFIIIFF